MCIIAKYGNAGALSNQIKLIRTTAEGSWTLTEDIKIIAIIRGVAQEVQA